MSIIKTRRAKILVGTSVVILIVGLTALTPLYNSLSTNYQPITFLPSSPININRNQTSTNRESPLNFNKYIPPKKTAKPVEIIPKKPESVKKQPPKPIETPKPVPTPKPIINQPKPVPPQPTPIVNPAPPVATPIPQRISDVIPKTQPDLHINVTQELINRALQSYQQGFDAEIKKVEQRITNAQQAYNNKVYVRDNKWNDYSPMWNKNKLSEYEWKAELAGQVSLAKYDLDKETSYLNWLKSQPKKTSFTQDEIKSLSRGLIPSETDLGVWRYDNPDDNPETGKNGRLVKNNQRRVFNTQSWYSQTPYDLAHGNFSGWDKQDVTNQYASVLEGFTNSIKVYHYTPNTQNVDKTRQPGDIVELDANDDNAFQKFQQVVQTLASQDKILRGVRIKNIGDQNNTQNAENILASIPDSIQSVYLFVDNYDATDSLKGLRGKHLKELAIYTDKNSLDSDWSVSPNDLADVDFISFDYNNQAEFGAYQGKIAGSIVFNTLRWYAGDDTNTIEKGLELAFGPKMEERPFQGSFGGKGGYPTALDFSLTDQNTFNGLNLEKVEQIYNDTVRTWKGDKYAGEDYEKHKLGFTKLIIGATDNVINFNADDLNNAGFTKWLIPSGPGSGPTIKLKDGYNDTNSATVYVKGTLNENGATQLIRFLNIANNSDSGNRIERVFVQNQPSNLPSENVVPSTSVITQIKIGTQDSSDDGDDGSDGDTEVNS